MFQLFGPSSISWLSIRNSKGYKLLLDYKVSALHSVWPYKIHSVSKIPTNMSFVMLEKKCSQLRRAVKKFPEFPWLKKCYNWLNVIEEWTSWSWNKQFASLTDPFVWFCPTIWGWDLSVRSLFRVVTASRWRTEPHIACCAAIPLRGKHSCYHPTTVLSGSRSEWLSAVPYSENGPKGGAFRTMEDIKSNATAELRKIPKEAFRQRFQHWQDRWSSCVCVFVCVRVRKGPTLKVIR